MAFVFLYKGSLYLQGSLYSPFLHDAMYLYAIALNKTLSQGGNISDGVLIVNNTRDLSFVGQLRGFEWFDSAKRSLQAPVAM